MYSEVDIAQSDDMRKTFKFAQFLATSDIIPSTFKNKPANVLIACQLAQRMNVPAMEVMQNMFMVHGNLSFKATYLIARANESGLFSEPIQYEIKGKNEDITITAYTYLKCGGERISAEVSFDMAKKEGWTKKKTNMKTGEEMVSKYETMPEQMLCYRAASFLIRRHAPQITLGFMTREEVEDTVDLNQSPREKLNSSFAQISKIHSSDKPKFIQKEELKLEAKESQLDDFEVMELCQA